MSVLSALRDELASCFNCNKKFKCQDAITGKYDPCEKWEKKNSKPEEKTIA